MVVGRGGKGGVRLTYTRPEFIRIYLAGLAMDAFTLPGLIAGFLTTLSFAPQVVQGSLACETRSSLRVSFSGPATGS